MSQIRARSEAAGLLHEIDAFADVVKERSAVVIATPISVALQLVADEHAIYTNYETLVGAGARTPANFANDSHRRVVAASLFGSYGEKIVYGVLSIDGNGLPTYGDIYWTLKPVAVEARVAFLETNSYHFVQRFNISPGREIPPGHRADWPRRHLLALAKLGPGLRKGQSHEQWARMFIYSDQRDRSNDEFIEALLYEGFNLFSVESIKASPSVDQVLKKQARLVTIAFEKHCALKRAPL